MPRAPKKCANPLCEVRVVARGYCDDHKPMNWGKGSSARTSTPQHKAWRLAVLKRDGFRCQIRGRRCLGKAGIADHVRNVAEGGAEHDVVNGQAVCTECHKEKTQVEAARARRRRAGADPLPPGDAAAGE